MPEQIAGPVIGIRAFGVSDNQLGPANTWAWNRRDGVRSSLWRIGEDVEADCRREHLRKLWGENDEPEAHDVPGPDCGCGLHGYIDNTSLGVMAAMPVVFGAVIGWGKLMLAHNGWRTRHARIVALVEASAIPDVIRAQCSEHCVPIVGSINECWSVAQRYGREVPARALPPVEEVQFGRYRPHPKPLPQTPLEAQRQAAIQKIREFKVKTPPYSQPTWQVNAAQAAPTHQYNQWRQQVVNRYHQGR